MTLLWLGLLPCQLFALPVSEIHFEGNAKTKETVLRQELRLSEGDEADIKLIEDSRKAIMNLGLFKSVASRLEEDGIGCILIFTVEERYYLLPIPLIGVQAKDGNAAEGIGSYNFGMELRHDNLMGLNHRLKLVYEDIESPGDDVPMSTKVSIDYTVPRIINTPYLFNVDAKNERDDVLERENDIDTGGSYRRETNSGGFYVSRWLNPQQISQGWAFGGGINARTTEYKNKQDVVQTYEDNQLLTVNTGLSFTDVQEYPYNREGEAYGYSLSVASTELGSDVSYTRHKLYFRRYQSLNITDSNLNTQVKLGVANGEITAFSLGNSKLLRGYDSNYVTGNAMLLLNAEYHHHLSGYRQLRGVFFVDAGNAWASVLDVDLGDLPVGVGVGLRWRVQSFVDVTLRVDYAYALGTGTDMLTLNTKTSF